MKPNVSELIDLEKVSELLEGFNITTGFVTAILDLEGNVLSKSGWRKICTEFHRVHPETSKRCTISDTVLANKMQKGEKYHAYTCLNGLTDVAVPVEINGQHVANLFSGQFLFDKPDVEFFRKQAKTFGFDEKEYLDALNKVPIVSEEKVKTILNFLLQMTQLISELGVEKAEQVELNKKLKEREEELKVSNQQLDAQIQQLKATEQRLRATNQQLIASESKFKSYIQNAPDGIFITDEKGKNLEINKAASVITEFTEDELLGSTFYNLIQDAYLENAINHFQIVLDDGYNTGEFGYKTKSGEERFWSLDAVKLTDNRFLIFAKDITERKQAEKAIIESERLSAIGELASGVAHDFNNSLQGIFGNIELSLLSNVPPEIQEYLETIKKSASDAASRIKQLQRFAGKNKESLKSETFDIREVVEDSLAATRTLWKDNVHKYGINIDIKTKFGKDCIINGNQADLRSVLYNLIKNSIQAMPEGGKLEIETRRDESKVYLSLSDTGQGMTEETKLRVFQPFYTTKGFEQGKGLGLSGAHSIISEHRGEIYVKSTSPGNGSTFEISLPYAEKVIDAENNLPQKYNGTAKVLWVDDEEMVRKVGKTMLLQIGHEVDTATGGNEALELLTENQYDLMISDVGMPGMSGWQLIEIVKDLYPEMNVAVLTGWGAEVSDEEKKKYNVNFVLGKPVELKVLETLISEVLRMNNI